MTDITEKSFALVERLEDHITTAAPEVWNATLAHIQVEAFGVIAVWALLPLSAIVCWIVQRKIGGESITVTGGKEEIPTTRGWVQILGWVLVGLSVICAMFGGVSTASELLVPEYHAIHEIAWMLGR